MIHFLCPTCREPHQRSTPGDKLYCRCGQKLEVPAEGTVDFVPADRVPESGPPLAPLIIGIVSSSLAGLGVFGLLFWPLLIFSVGGIVTGIIGCVMAKAEHGAAGRVCAFCGLGVSVATVVIAAILLVVALTAVAPVEPGDDEFFFPRKRRF